jgi:tRNA dimethylallyltransferase
MVNYALIICGSTASGKTELSLQIAAKIKPINVEIINADVGQMYKQLSVGTAKPSWRESGVRHELFDVVDGPNNINVVEYRTMVMKAAKDMWERGSLPIIVGGSLFYVRSLLFPPRGAVPSRESVSSCGAVHTREAVPSHGGLWEKLNKIDSQRAREIHPNDIYRINRALEVWERTGKKPSECKPELKEGINARIIFINRDRKELFERINARTGVMIKNGWIEETRGLSDEWKKFLKQKKLIGYPEIIEWIEAGEKKESMDNMVDRIKQKTRQYAKRQVTFWKKFNILTNIEEISMVDERTVTKIIKQIKHDMAQTNLSHIMLKKGEK